jgi:hypothetical protein
MIDSFQVSELNTVFLNSKPSPWLSDGDDPRPVAGTTTLDGRDPDIGG